MNGADMCDDRPSPRGEATLPITNGSEPVPQVEETPWWECPYYRYTGAIYFLGELETRRLSARGEETIRRLAGKGDNGNPGSCGFSDLCNVNERPNSPPICIHDEPLTGWEQGWWT